MLKVECESCKAPYQVDERRVPPTGLKMRCPKCGHTFLVTDPSKGGAAAAASDAGGAGKGAPPPKKATMVGFGAVGAPPVPGAKPPIPIPAAKPPIDAGMALPAVKPAPPKPVPGKSTTIGTGPAAPPIPQAALPKLDDLDLPALAGD